MVRRADPEYDYLPPLGQDQGAAAQPDAHVWLSASAGTGKTQVLAARVLRLLLAGVRPESIQCLTFTKAGATEMASRVRTILARWVMADEANLMADLAALGEPATVDQCRDARRLFARLLDARGGGLRIQTIHSFCQSLLGSFPVEAGLTPGFRLVEDRELEQVRTGVLSGMVREADETLRADMAALGLDQGQERALSFLERCAAAPDAMRALPERPGLRPWLHRLLSGGTSDLWDLAQQLCAEPPPEVEQVALACEAWGRDNGIKCATKIRIWLALPPDLRAERYPEGENGWLTNTRTPRAASWVSKEGAELAMALKPWSDQVHTVVCLAQQADRMVPALHAGRIFALRFAEAKAQAGLVDYGDLIQRTATLLNTPGMGEWVRYKLDAATDHILIDEAQDTNEAQWDIIKALGAEYFDGAGATQAVRTLFTVGDYKQAIFGFQGTDPANFSAARQHFAAKSEAAGQEWVDLALSRSFRSTPTVLNLTDAVINLVGHEALGLDTPVDPHLAEFEGPGSVLLTAPIPSGSDAWDDGDDEGEEGWISEGERKLADQVAQHIFHLWKVDPLWLPRQKRSFRPGDAMILLRKRGELARLIVARLHERGIPVAGLDRLRVGAPLAVQDLVACARFAMQPEDDLSLAGILVSPLVGLSQDELYAVAKGRRGALWPHLDDDLRTQIMPLLDMADRVSPYRFFEAILSGPMQGRKRLLARLGEEARDPINALLAAALEFEAKHPPSLQLFLDWFDKGDSEIKRDPEAGGGAVRVMTVHGSKGLQAPLVILADAAGHTDERSTGLDFPLDGVAGKGQLPLLPVNKNERTGGLADAREDQKAREAREHLRLLYVAITRAEAHLVVAGALTAKHKNGPPELSWHNIIWRAMQNKGAVPITHACWTGEALLLSQGDTAPPQLSHGSSATLDPLPDWLLTPPAPESTPPRPLAPSSLGPDDASAPPPSPAMIAAAEQGRLLHSLFERLPPIAAERRAAVADRWLAQSAGLADASRRSDLVRTAVSVMENEELSHWFASDGLAEAPLAGVVDGVVIAGTVDRLIVRDDAVWVIDYKTGQRVPPRAEAAPLSHLRQMAAYVALLRSIFPDRPVKAALLYTAGPVCHVLPDALVATHKPDLAWAQ